MQTTGKGIGIFVVLIAVMFSFYIPLALSSGEFAQAQQIANQIYDMIIAVIIFMVLFVFLGVRGSASFRR